jgi:sulfur carrier protein
MIRVNKRDDVEWAEGLTVAALLERFRHIPAHVVVTVNGQVVPKEEQAAFLIPDGAEVRVIHLIAGG